jgi:Cu-processing system permease protein
MNSLVKILKFTFYDMLRSWWAVLYFLFFLVSATSLLYFSGDFTKAVSSLLNIILLIVPLVSIIFGTMFYYNSREFVELLLAQPLKRSSIFLGQYLGLSISLVLSYCLGISIAFLIYQGSIEEFYLLLLLLFCGSFLTLIFIGLSFYISASQEDKIKGFGLAILLWLLAAIIYDGLFLALLTVFQDYPLETPSIFLSLLNPIDLTRIMVLLQLESATLMGFTGAVFNKFFGTFYGTLVSFCMLLVWIIIPLLGFIYKVNRKDF